MPRNPTTPITAAPSHRAAHCSRCGLPFTEAGPLPDGDGGRLCVPCADDLGGFEEDADA